MARRDNLNQKSENFIYPAFGQYFGLERSPVIYRDLRGIIYNVHPNPEIPSAIGKCVEVIYNAMRTLARLVKGSFNFNMLECRRDFCFVLSRVLRGRLDARYQEVMLCPHVY
jgi:hypothetical protein